jgi:hypothetical protein
MIRIERLRIDAGTMSPAEGARLAELVAAALGQAARPVRPGATSLRVAVQPPAGQSLTQLADQIAAAIIRALARGEAG